VHILHGLKEPDKEERLTYIGWFTHFSLGSIDILDKVFLSSLDCKSHSGIHQKNLDKLLSCTIQMSLQKLYVGLLQM
jgi:hypothetical protein